MKKTDSRYPYTYACDFIRALAGYNSGGSTKLSRADASGIRSGIADALGMEDELLANKLADKEIAKTDEDYDRQILAFSRAREQRSKY